MDTTENTPENTVVSPADVATVGKSLKIPGWLSVELDKEIADAGMSFNSYVQNILINRHNQIPDDIEQQIEAMQTKIAEQQDLLTTKGYKNNELLEEVVSLRSVEDQLEKVKAERDTYFAEIARLEDDYMKLETLCKSEAFGNHRPVEEPKVEKSDKILPNDSDALRAIILENTFFSNLDIDLLLHEAANS